MSLSTKIARTIDNIECMVNTIQCDVDDGHHKQAREAAELCQQESAELMALVAELERRHR